MTDQDTTALTKGEVTTGTNDSKNQTPPPTQSEGVANYFIPEKAVLTSVSKPETPPSSAAPSPVSSKEPLNTGREQLLAELDSAFNQKVQGQNPVPASPINYIPPSARRSLDEGSPSALNAFVPEEISSEKKSSEIAPIRTLKGDIAAAIKHQNVSLAGIAIKEAEARRREVQVVERTSRAKIFLTTLSVLLILGGAGAAAYFFFFRTTQTPIQIEIEKQTATLPILIDKTDSLDISGERPEVLRRKLSDFIKNIQLRIGFIEKLSLTESTIGADGLTSTRVIAAPEIFDLLRLRATAKLPRFLKNDFLFGIYAFKHTSGFLIFNAYSYQGVFAEMLSWERTMAEDLYPVLSGNALPPGAETLTFRDEVIKNIDARTLRRPDGTLLLIYSFLNTRDKLFIGTDADAFAEVITRLQTPKKTTQ